MPPRKTSTKTTTKKDLKEAVDPVQTALSENEENVLNPEKIRETAIRKEIYEKADSAVSADIAVCVDALKNAICRELSDLSSKLETEAAKYKNLQEALKLKEAELKQIYDIDAAASSLLALIEAHRMKREEFEAEEAKWTSDFAGKKLEAEAQFAQETAEAEKKRKREQEEYDYNWKRECERKKILLEDELSRLRKNIAAEKSEFDAATEKKTAELDAREADISSKEEAFARLEMQVADFPAAIDAAVIKARSELSDKLNQEFALKEQLLSKDFEGDKKVFESKIASLKELVDTQAKQIEELTVRQEKAYEKVQDIATKAVANCGKTIFAHAQESHSN